MTTPRVHAIRTTDGPLPKLDTHSCPKNGNRGATRPTGRVEYRYNSVQEIGSGTSAIRPLIKTLEEDATSP
jgi:hypothetical protein